MVDIPQTPNFKLFKPPFDRKAWHRYISDNFSIIDAVLTTYLEVGNIVGVWSNSTSYLVGQRVIDSDVGQVFECNANHTSAAGPSTFAEDRTANPTYWTSLAVTARGLGAWTPGTDYEPNDFVVSGTVYAVCIATHTSGAVFADDAVYWDYLVDISTLPTLPAITGQALNVLRVNAGETQAEWASDASIIAWLGLDSAAFLPSSTFAAAIHSHTTGSITDMTAAGVAIATAADAAAQRTALGLGSLATLSTVATAQINNDAVTYAKIQNVTDSRLLGRAAGSAGDAQEITVSTGLSLSGGALSVSTIPTVSAYKSANQAGIVSATYTKVTFDTEDFDTANLFASSTFTPSAGKWCIVVNIRWFSTNGSDNEGLDTALYKDGVLFQSVFHRRNGVSTGAFSSTFVVSADGTDTFEIYVQKSAAGNGEIEGGATRYTTFSAFRIST